MAKARTLDEIGTRFDHCVTKVGKKRRLGKKRATKICAKTFHRAYGKKFVALSVRGRKRAAARRRNPARGRPADTIAARELALYAENDAGLYHRMRRPIEANHTRKMQKGIYDHEKALKSWESFATLAAQQYAREFGGTYNIIFSMATRRLAAKHMRETFENEAKAVGVWR